MMLPAVLLALLMVWVVVQSIATSNWADGLGLLVPVVLRDRPVCLVFAAQPQRGADDALSDLLAVVAAMEEAYLRIIRDAKKIAPGTTTPPVEP